MAFAFGHLIGAWLLGKIYEKTSKKKILHLAWFFLLLGGILPDADFLLDWTIGTELHRTFSHSIIFLVVVPFILWVILKLLKREDHLQLSIALAGGILTHLLLDMISLHGVPLLWPSLLHFSSTSISYFDPSSTSLFTATAAKYKEYLQLAVVDMALGTTWIFYLWFRKRIQF